MTYFTLDVKQQSIRPSNNTEAYNLNAVIDQQMEPKHQLNTEPISERKNKQQHGEPILTIHIICITVRTQ